MKARHLIGAPRGSFAWLLVSLLLLLVVGGFLEENHGGQGLGYGLVTLALGTSIYSVSHHRPYVWAGGLLAALSFGGLWLGWFTGAVAAEAIGLGAGFVFFFAAAMVILLAVLSRSAISADELAAAVSVYLLLGIAGAFVFALVDLLVPGSLVYTSPGLGDGPLHLGEHVYFSFTCLTTLGFGDLIATTPQARVFAYLEAVIGQVYLTVLVARLVGLHLTQTRSGPS